MRFGAEQFEKHFAYSGPVKRLRTLLQYARGISLSNDDPLVQVVLRLSRRRNMLFHPRAYSSTMDEDGVLQTPDAAWQAPTKIVDADASIADMREFFARFPALDPETATFLRPWPVRRQPN